jgi:hypothetical protein
VQLDGPAPAHADPTGPAGRPFRERPEGGPEPMSTDSTSSVPVREEGARDAIAGLLASAAIFASVLGLAYRPARIIPFAIVLALVSARMSTRWSRLAGIAVVAVVVCWVLGMTIAVLTQNPLY